MLSTTRFLVGLITQTLRRNFKRSLTIIFAFILVLSSTVAMIGWLETSPEITIEKIFDNSGYEIKITETEFQTNSFNFLDEYLEIEPLVDSTSIVHKTIFHYNLEGRAPEFNITAPPVNESDFYISNWDASDGVFFVSDGYITNIQRLLKFEIGSNVSFTSNNGESSGIIISRRLLNKIEEKTNNSFLVGDTIDFGIVLGIISPSLNNLSSIQSRFYTAFQINAIFDREPVSTKFGLEYPHETLGDGVFLSHELLSLDEFETIENDLTIRSRVLFLRVDRSELKKLQIRQVSTEINNLASRIILQGEYEVNAQTEQITILIGFFDQSRVVLLILLLPLFILSEILYFSLIPHILRNRIDEYHYQRLRGTTDRRIFTVQLIEFSVLAIIGSIIGILIGIIFLDVLSSSSEFLKFSVEQIGKNMIHFLSSGNILWIYGVLGIIFLNVFFFIRELRKIVRDLQRREGNKPSSRMISKTKTRYGILRLFVGILGLYLTYSFVSPLFFEGFGTSGITSQLVPLLSILLVIIWVLISFYTPQVLLRILQSILESLRIFSNPRRKLTYLNLFRRRTQYISFLALLTLTISLLSFTLIYYETLSTHAEKNAEYMIGTDIQLITSSTNSEQFTTRIESLDGIKSCIGLPYRDVIMENFAIRLIGVDSVKYSGISEMFSKSTIEGPESSEFWNNFNSNWNNTIILNDFLTDVFKWEIGDNIGIRGLLSENDVYTFSISAIASSAPGIGILYTGEFSKGYFSNGGFAIVHEQLLEAFGTDMAETFLVQVNDQNQIPTILDDLRQIAEVRVVESGFSIEEERSFILQLTGIHGILTIDFLGGILISLIGIAVFYQYLVSDRITDFAVFQALGATKRKIFRIAFMESLILIVLGLTLGVISGTFFAIGFLLFTQEVTVLANNIYSLELIISPVLFLISLTIVTMLVIIATAFPLKKIYELEITNILRGD
ncbi:MAG: ABC transporter permease [Candidatus Hodarchaeales archaeon]|jgi:ABC-type lipoprotein release transport system permease subunit